MSWTHVAATGIGSLPGTDPAEAARFVLGELPLPHLPELPARGAHADLAGRGAALLADLHVDLQPTGWRLVPRPSRDGRRAKDLLARDLDALEEVIAGSGPESLKLQATGPWTLAALLELPRGNRALSDPGAVADLAESLAQGVRAHLADVQRRLPGTRLVLQLDEPLLPTVLAGRVPTASGFGALRIPPEPVVRERLSAVLSAGATTVVHCCAPDPPIALMALADAVSFDATLPVDHDRLGEAVEQGTGVLLGVVPGAVAGALAVVPAVGEIVQTVGRLRDRCAVTQVTLTPSCGLAGATPEHVRAVLRRLVEAARELPA